MPRVLRSKHWSCIDSTNRRWGLRFTHGSGVTEQQVRELWPSVVHATPRPAPFATRPLRAEPSEDEDE